MSAIAGTVLERRTSDVEWLEPGRAPAIVILLRRIREHYDRSGDNKEAVAILIDVVIVRSILVPEFMLMIVSGDD